ncbi:hypothetical protein BGZ73_001574, partial [Actinomortierella ambigua]
MSGLTPGSREKNFLAKAYAEVEANNNRYLGEGATAVMKAEMARSLQYKSELRLAQPADDDSDTSDDEISIDV